MEKSYIFIGIVGIILFALIGFNLDNITGEVTKNLVPDVTAYPQTVKAGEMINIKVRPRNGCVDPEIGFYFSGRLSDNSIVSSGGRKGAVTQKGGYKICKGDGLILDKDGTFTVSYKTEPVWDGEYFGKIFYWKDRNTKGSTNIYFNVLPKTN